jgi:uncharacterized RDD family membrane protein YckC
MFCPKCGKETDASGKFCQWCGADIESAPAKAVIAPEDEAAPEVGVYAGLGKRIIAFIIDIILILVFDLVVASVFGLLRGVQNLYFYAYQHAPIESLTPEGTRVALVTSIIASYGILFVVIPWLYYASFESSRSQATPGKVLIHAQVTDLEGNRVSYARATIRFFAKFISLVIFFIGFIMIGFTKKKQGLHDKIAGCLVLLQD